MSINFLRFITFYTEGYYEEVFNTYLGPSSKKVGLDIKHTKLPNLRDWTINTRLKAQFILNSLLECDEDIVFIDSDATLLSYPSLFTEISSEYDLAIHYFDWWRHWRGIEGKEEKELYNAVMLCRNNDKIKKMLRAWIELNKRTVKFEQKVLEDILKMMPEIKVFDLPVEYACVATREGKVPDYVKNPVIFQNQISRNVKQNKNLLLR